MECEDTPDLGASANVVGYNWNNEKFFKTMINISCEVGKSLLSIKVYTSLL